VRFDRIRIPLITGAVAATGAMLAFALPAGAAVAVQSQSPPTPAVTLGRTATLDARGAVVFAPVDVVCPPGSYTALSVTVAENVGGNIASGTTRTQIQPCTGSVQSLNVAVIPTQKAFRTGVAFGQAQLDVCTTTCSTAVDQHNVRIVARR
jgi:hypothetical protein